MVERLHNIKHCRIWPSVSFNLADLVRRNHPFSSTIQGNDEKPSAGADQVLVDESFQIRMPVYSRIFPRHYVDNFDTAQCFRDFHLRITFTRSAKQEPTDEGDP